MSQLPIPAIPSSKTTPLDPAQRKFNQLLAKLDKARTELADWQVESARFGTAYEEIARPLLAELQVCRVSATKRLGQLLDDTGWTRAERLLLRELTCELAGTLIGSGQLDADQEASLRALHDKHADVDFDTGNRQAMAEVKSLFEAMSGLDLGDEDVGSEEELLQRAQQRLQAEFREQEAQAGEGKFAQPKKRGRVSAKAKREQEDAQAASQTLREVYRKLAAALHPDRAADEADRAERTGRMQRANQAYEAQDLLGLLALQLEIEQVDAAHVARITSERASHLNRLLTEQLQELQAELTARRFAFCHAYELDPYQPLAAKKLGRLLQREVAELRGALAQAAQDLRQLGGERAAAKRWLKAAQRERDADFAFDLPF